MAALLRPSKELGFQPNCWEAGPNQPLPPIAEQDKDCYRAVEVGWLRAGGLCRLTGGGGILVALRMGG